MDKIKQIQGMLKSDKVIINSIRSNVGRNESPSIIIDLQNQLAYTKAESLISEIKSSGNFFGIADKIIRFENEIKKLRSVEFQLWQYLNSVKTTIPFKKKTKLPEKETWLTIPVNFNGIQQFNHINNESLPIVLSIDKVIDLVKMPHLLVAGSTGSGKSVFLNVAILSLISKLDSNQCKLALIDPKRVEFSLYRSVPHLYSQIATKLDQIDELLANLIDEMEKRYSELQRVDVKSIESYNQQEKNNLPYIVIVIDELADLMMTTGKSVSDKITRLAQLARAAGIHIIMATQRPVAEIMTGLIKSNMPARISFRVESKADSRIILDESGAETLKGAGEMLFKCNGAIEKFQGIYIPEQQIKKICGIKKG